MAKTAKSTRTTEAEAVTTEPGLSADPPAVATATEALGEQPDAQATAAAPPADPGAPDPAPPAPTPAAPPAPKLSLVEAIRAKAKAKEAADKEAYQAAVRTAELGQQFRDLIGRASDPADGDTEALPPLLEALGLTLAEAQADIDAVARIKQLERQIIGPERLEVKGKEAQQALADMRAAEQALTEAKMRLHRTDGELRGMERRNNEIRGDILLTKQRCPRLFADEWPGKPAK